MTETLKGKTRAEAEALFRDFHDLVTGTGRRRSRTSSASSPSSPASASSPPASSAPRCAGTPPARRSKAERNRYRPNEARSPQRRRDAEASCEQAISASLRLCGERLRQSMALRRSDTLPRRRSGDDPAGRHDDAEGGHAGGDHAVAGRQLHAAGADLRRPLPALGQGRRRDRQSRGAAARTKRPSIPTRRSPRIRSTPSCARSTTPRFPVNIVELGLVYDLAIEPLPTGGSRVAVKMTLTAPGCGMGDIIAARRQAAHRQPFPASPKPTCRSSSTRPGTRA